MLFYFPFYYYFAIDPIGIPYCHSKYIKDVIRFMTYIIKKLYVPTIVLGVEDTMTK